MAFSQCIGREGERERGRKRARTREREQEWKPSTANEACETQASLESCTTCSVLPPCSSWKLQNSCSQSSQRHEMCDHWGGRGGWGYRIHMRFYGLLRFHSNVGFEDPLRLQVPSPGPLSTKKMIYYYVLLLFSYITTDVYHDVFQAILLVGHFPILSYPESTPRYTTMHVMLGSAKTGAHQISETPCNEPSLQQV